LAVRAGQRNLKGKIFSHFGFAAYLPLAGELQRLVVEVLVDRQQAETARSDGFDLSDVIDEALLGNDLWLGAARVVSTDDLDAGFGKGIEIGRRVD